MTGIHRSPEPLARAQGRERLKRDITLSLVVNRAVLIGVNLRNAPCRLYTATLEVTPVPWEPCGFPRYLPLCVQVEPRRGQLMAEQGLISGSHLLHRPDVPIPLLHRFLKPEGYSLNPRPLFLNDSPDIRGRDLLLLPTLLTGFLPVKPLQSLV